MTCSRKFTGAFFNRCGRIQEYTNGKSQELNPIVDFFREKETSGCLHNR